VLNNIQEYFGFKKQEASIVVYPESFDFPDNLDLKKEYLNALEAQEASRQSIIETKTSQLIGQAGIIFSLLSLFISNYFFKFRDLPVSIQGIFISIFLITLMFYLITILHATKYLNVIKYVYAQRSVSTVLAKFDNEIDFKIEEIKDLIYSIERNTKVNNQKSNNLIYAYRSFRVGTICVGLLSVLLISSGYFISPSPKNKVIIENPVIIKGLDSVIHEMRKQPETRVLMPVVNNDSSNIKGR